MAFCTKKERNFNTTTVQIIKRIRIIYLIHFIVIPRYVHGEKLQPERNHRHFAFCLRALTCGKSVRRRSGTNRTRHPTRTNPYNHMVVHCQTQKKKQKRQTCQIPYIFYVRCRVRLVLERRVTATVSPGVGTAVHNTFNLLSLMFNAIITIQ